MPMSQWNVAGYYNNIFENYKIIVHKSMNLTQYTKNFTLFPLPFNILVALSKGIFSLLYNSAINEVSLFIQID